MSLSVGRVSGVSSSAVSSVGTRNYAYSVANESKVSSAYTERISGIDPTQAVDPADPVKYASAARGRQAEASKEASAGFNDLASSFATGGYDNSGSSYAYSVVGKNYDEFA